MALKVLKEIDNPVLCRKEYEIKIDFDQKTPSNDEVAGEIAKVAKSSVDSIKIKKIDTAFGERSAVVSAFVYTSKDDLERIEVKSKKQIEAEKKAIEDAKKAKEEAKKAEADKPAKEEAKPVENKPAEDAKPEAAKDKPAEEKADAPAKEKKE